MHNRLKAILSVVLLGATLGATTALKTPENGVQVLLNRTQVAEISKTWVAQETHKIDPRRNWSPDTSRSYARQTLALRGVDHSEWVCLEKLWTRESNWRHTAQNKTSTAFGIAQFLDATWKGVGIEKSRNPYVQIQAGLIYIEKRYKTPCQALAHSDRVGWY
jgi:hypothetical protein